MQKKTRKLLLFIFLMGAVLPLSAQNISLKQAINFALKNKADATKADLDIENAEYRISEVRADALPQLNGTGSLAYNPILQETALPGDFVGKPGEILMVPFGQKWDSHIGAELKQTLFNQQVFVGLKAARTTKEFYRINRKLTDEKLIEKVSTAYYDVFSVQYQLATIDSSYVNTKKIKNVILDLYENGLAKKVDLDRVKVKLINLSTTRTKLKNEVNQRENALKFYMGMSIEQPITLLEADFEVEPPLMENEIDVDQRTEIQSMNKQKTLMEYNIKAEKAANYPSLALVGNYAWQATGDKFPLGKGKTDNVYWTDYASVGLQLNIPIFNGFRTKSKVNQRKNELQSFQEDIKDAKLGMNLDYENAKAQMENSLKTITDQETNLELAQSVLNDIHNNYKNGLASLTDLLQAENELVEAKNNYSDAFLDYKKAEIQLYKAKGELERFTE